MGLLQPIPYLQVGGRPGDLAQVEMGVAQLGDDPCGHGLPFRTRLKVAVDTLVASPFNTA
jgi:hypothetical protein